MDLQAQLDRAVFAWLSWLPRWRPASHRGRVSVCRRCLGSPILAAAGLANDVPHGVQHAFTVRVKAVLDAAVSQYTELNLPLLQAELDQQAARNRRRTYRASDGLDPEFAGMPLDPQPNPEAPFLFTLAGLEAEADASLSALPPLSEEQKHALRHEVNLADNYAELVGREVCRMLLRHRLRVGEGLAKYVEPQIERMLAELTESLDMPFEPPGIEPLH